MSDLPWCAICWILREYPTTSRATNPGRQEIAESAAFSRCVKCSLILQALDKIFPVWAEEPDSRDYWGATAGNHHLEWTSQDFKMFEIEFFTLPGRFICLTVLFLLTAND